MITDYEKMFIRDYTGKESSFDLFKRWAESRGVNKFIRLAPLWQQVTRQDISSSTKVNGDPYLDQWHYPLWDHVSLWQTIASNKIIVAHPYFYLPGDMESCFAYISSEFGRNAREEIDKFASWANARGLEVKLFGSGYSWYYPGKTILVEIREKGGTEK